MRYDGTPSLAKLFLSQTRAHLRARKAPFSMKPMFLATRLRRSLLLGSLSLGLITAGVFFAHAQEAATPQTPAASPASPAPTEVAPQATDSDSTPSDTSSTKTKKKKDKASKKSGDAPTAICRDGTYDYTNIHKTEAGNREKKKPCEKHGGVSRSLQ